MKKALITGALGQDGTYLAEHLIGKGYNVYGLVRRHQETSSWWRMFSELGELDKIQFLFGDVTDELSLRVAIQKSWPDEIYNLAGQVFVPMSWDCPAQTFDVNTSGLARILKIVEHVKPDTRVYQASSSEMIGNFEGSFNEDTPMWPTSPYGISKLAAHRLVGLYRDRGMYVCSGILSNHESPRRGEEMVTRKIAKAVAAWSQGDETVLLLGLLDSRRDWGYARDYVEAMHLMLQQEKPSDYVIGTGVTHSVRDFLEEACKEAEITSEFLEAHLRIDPRFTRRQEIHSMCADTSKFRKLTGWRPKVDFKELVQTMVRYEKLSRLQEQELAISYDHNS